METTDKKDGTVAGMSYTTIAILAAVGVLIVAGGVWLASKVSS